MTEAPRFRVDPGWVACGLLVLVFGLWPYRELFDQLPWGADATKWVAGASLDNPGWWDWCTDRKHFVGYRPITAFTFLLDQALFGYSARGYRGTDLLLHASTGLLLYGLWRALTGDRGPAGLVPVLLLFGHPATEEVVPYVARRSYLLANGFGLATLLATVALGRAQRRLPLWSAVVAALLGLAVLSNEVAFVVLPLLPPLVLIVTPPEHQRARLAGLGPAVVVAAAAIVLRHSVLGVWGGGYRRRYFALVRDGVTVWTELHSWEPRLIANACFRYLFNPNNPGGRPPLFDGWALTGVLVVAGAWLAWRAALRPALRRTVPDALAAWLGLWMLGAAAIVVLSQTWFWRQAYTLLPPLGLLLGLGLRDAARAVSERRWVGLVELGLCGVLLSAGLFTGPAVWGMDQRVHSQRLAGAPYALRARDALAPVKGPAVVYLVAPTRGSNAQIVRLWGDRFGADRRITFRVLAQLGDATPPEDARARVETDGDRPALVLERGFTWTLSAVPPAYRNTPRMELDRLHRRGRRAFVMVLDGDGDEVFEVPAPPAGVTPEDWAERVEVSEPDDEETPEAP